MKAVFQLTSREGRVAVVVANDLGAARALATTHGPPGIVWDDCEAYVLAECPNSRTNRVVCVGRFGG